MILTTPSASSTSIIYALTANEPETSDRGKISARSGRDRLGLAGLFASNVFLGICNYNPVDDGAFFAREVCASRGLADGGSRPTVRRLRWRGF
jgi:hypothetical protein